MKIKNIKTKQLPIVVDKKYQQYVPASVREYTEMEFHDINTAFVNGFRRILCNEIKVKCLYLDDNSPYYDCNDDFMLIDYVINRIKMIPINQQIPDIKLYLDVANNTQELMLVKTSDLKTNSNVNLSKYIDQNITILQLQPGKHANIREITIASMYGHAFGGAKLTTNATQVPLDQTPIDLETRKGISSSVSNPRSHKLSFYTNGTMPSKNIMAEACNAYREKLTFTQSLLEDIKYRGDDAILIIPGESDTVGNLLVKTITEQTDEYNSITYNVILDSRKVVVTLNTNGDAIQIFKNAIKHCLKQIEAVKKYF